MFFRMEYLTTMPNPVPGSLVVVNGTQLVPTPPLVFVDRILISLADRIHDLISLPWSIIFQSPPPKLLKPASLSSQNALTTTQHKKFSITKQEVKFVMQKLDFFTSCQQELVDGDDDEEIIGADELTSMFDESEPSLEELKQTFDVFDKNRDGFIDAEELHRVLGLLGSNSGIFIHDCHRMIAKFDHNNDGKIDFNEFVKFMEIAFS